MRMAFGKKGGWVVFGECVVSDELFGIVLVEDWDGDGTVERVTGKEVVVC